MGAPTIKEKLHHFIEDGDPKLIKMLYAVAKEYTQDDYTLSGKPMTATQLKKRVREAKARIAKGQYTTHDDLEKEMQEW